MLLQIISMLSVLLAMTSSLLITFLLVVLILCLVLYAVKVLFGWLQVPQGIQTVIYIIVAIIFIVWTANFFGLANF